MKNTKYTTGKWEIIEDYDDAYSQQVFNISNEVDGCMATIWTGAGKIEEIEEQTKANALLISKAPEMLEMLKEINDCRNLYDRWADIEQLIKEAIEIN